MSSDRVTIVPDHLEQSASRLQHLVGRLHEVELALLKQTAGLPEQLAELAREMKMPIAKGIRLEADRLEWIAKRLLVVAAAARHAAQEGLPFDGRTDSTTHVSATHSPAPPKGDPAKVAKWWASLSPEERQRLLEEDPRLLASLDGVPAEWRDKANEVLLQQRIDWLRWKVATGQATSDEMNELGKDSEIQKTIKASVDDERTGRGPRLFLLNFDPDHQHIIVAVGNPDTATDIGVYVPGDNSGWGSVPSNIDVVRQLDDQAQYEAPGHRVSTVVWIGYDSPSFPSLSSDPRSSKPADDAVVPLNNFTTGLRVTHQGPPARLTLVGLSYGTVVVGDAAAHSPSKLPVDNVVFLGSPGTTTENAAQLNLPANSHVYAAAHEADPFARKPLFGRSPVDPSYGATRVPTQLRSLSPLDTHNYTDPHVDKLVFRNTARIIVGKPLLT